jgi:hypothetical protein
MRISVCLILNAVVLLAQNQQGGGLPAPSTGYDQSVANANALLAKGDFAKAAAQAAAAIKANPDRYEAYLAVSMALYKQDALAQSEEYAKRARQLAPADKRGLADNILQAITDKRVFQPGGGLAKPPAAYDRSVANANALLGKGDFVEALSQATAAIKANPDRWEAYLTVSMALYKQDALAQSAEYARKASQLAPADKRGMADNILQAIGDKQVFIESVSGADRDLAAGLTSKAAEAYEKAWKLLPMKEDLGIKVANLWLQVGEPGRAATILRRIVEQHYSPAFAQEAANILAKSQATLVKSYDKKMSDCATAQQKQDRAGALSCLAMAAEMLPDRYEPLVAAARAHAARCDIQETEKTLVKAIAVGKLSLDTVLGYPELVPYLDSERFLKFLTDVFGANVRLQAGTQRATWAAIRQLSDNKQALQNEVQGSNARMDTLHGNKLEIDSDLTDAREHVRDLRHDRNECYGNFKHCGEKFDGAIKDADKRVLEAIGRQNKVEAELRSVSSALRAAQSQLESTARQLAATPSQLDRAGFLNSPRAACK